MNRPHVDFGFHGAWPIDELLEQRLDDQHRNHSDGDRVTARPTEASDQVKG